MKRFFRNKGLFILLCSVMSLLFVLCSAGCSKNSDDSDESSSPEKEITLTLDRSQAVLILGEEVWIQAKHTEAEGETLSWSSDNEAVATVQDGKVTANSVGNASITATYADKTATCAVTVSSEDMVPVMVFGGIPDEETITVSLLDNLNLRPEIRFNGKSYSDGEFETHVSDETVGSLDDGVFKPLRVGETSISVKGKWRGLEGACLNRTLNVKVIDDLSIVVNGGRTSSLVLYTTELHGGKSYDTSAPFEVSAKENGVDIEYRIKISEGDDVIAYDEETESVSALTYGSANIAVEFTRVGGAVGTLNIPVTVIRPITDYESPIEYFSALDGELPTEEIFGRKTEVIDAYCGNEPLSVESGKILGVKTERTCMTEQTVTVYDDTVGYRLTLEAYTKILKTENDLTVFNEDRDGYFVMSGDIECSGTVMIQNAGKFCGVFEGNGHLIKKPKVSVNTGTNPISGGIFGVLGNYAVIRNVGIVDVDSSPYSSSVLAGGSTTQYFAGALIENVYIKVAKCGARPGVLMWTRGPWDVFNNVLIDLGNTEFGSFGNAYGAMFASDSYPVAENGSVWAKDNANIKNVYVIARENIPLSDNVKYNTRYPAKISAQNDGVQEDASLNRYVYTGVTRFGDMFSLAGTVNRIGDENNYWTITETSVEWKGKLPEFETVEYDKVVEFSALDGDLPVEDIFGKPDVVITEAYQGGTALSVVNNKVLGVATKNNEMTVTKIVVCSTTGKYSVTLNAYTKIIDEESDLSVFDVTNGTVTGYYVLNSDVVCTGEKEWKNISTDRTTKYFDGIFDGRGHKIIGLRVGEKGLFGTLGNNAVIKNVAFTDSILSDVEEWKYTPFLAFESIAGNNSPSKIENVYICFANFRATKGGNRGAGLLFIYNSNILIKDVIVEIKTKNLMEVPQYGYGALFEEDRVHGAANNLVNVVVVSKLVPLAMHVGVNLETGIAAYSWATYAGNDKDTAGKFEKEKYYYYEGVSRYDDTAALSEAKGKIGNWKATADGIVWEE